MVATCRYYIWVALYHHLKNKLQTTRTTSHTSQIFKIQNRYKSIKLEDIQTLPNNLLSIAPGAPGSHVLCLWSQAWHPAPRRSSGQCGHRLWVWRRQRRQRRQVPRLLWSFGDPPNDTSQRRDVGFDVSYYTDIYIYTILCIYIYIV